MLTAELSKDGKNLIVSIPVCEPRESSTGKSLIVATSSGFTATGAVMNKQSIKVNLTALIAKG